MKRKTKQPPWLVKALKRYHEIYDAFGIKEKEKMKYKLDEILTPMFFACFIILLFVLVLIFA